MVGDLNLIYVVIGAIALIAGAVMIVRAIKRKPGTSPKATAMLIAGMMIATFGFLIAAFAIGFATSEPPVLTAEAAS